MRYFASFRDEIRDAVRLRRNSCVCIRCPLHGREIKLPSVSGFSFSFLLRQCRRHRLPRFKTTILANNKDKNIEGHLAVTLFYSVLVSFFSSVFFLSAHLSEISISIDSYEN